MRRSEQAIATEFGADGWQVMQAFFILTILT
jgi:hypothetical protein